MSISRNDPLDMKSVFVVSTFVKDVLPWWTFLRLQNWYPLIQSSHCNSLKDQGSVVPDFQVSYSVLTKW